MKKRMLAALLALALLLAAAPSAFADAVRDTDFFTARPHAEVDFQDMAYVPVDVEAELAKMDAVRQLAADPANLEQVRQGFEAACAASRNARTMDALASIYSSQDYSDETASLRLQEAEKNAMLVQDGLFLLIRDLLSTPCAGVLEGLLTPEDVEDFLEYEPLTAEELERDEQETAMENEYWTLSGQSFSYEYGGKLWDEEAAVEAVSLGEITYEDYLTITRAIAKNENEVLAPHYLRLVELNNEIALASGYDSFTEYAYDLYYSRDYTPEEIQAFHQAVKEEIVPVYNDLEQLWYSVETPDSFFEDYTGDTALDLMEPYIAALSDELLESFRYMRSHKLYDSGRGERKNDQGYTIALPSYNAAFFFNNPSGSVWDLLTAVHEFGHFNNIYWTDDLWYGGSKGIDTAEVHSQGLELLFSAFYPELFGEGSDATLIYLLLNKVNAIVEGALEDELQQFVYGTPGVTVEQINREYCRLCREYGLIDQDDERTELYDWVETPHTFVSPLYYISYAVSAAGAFSFWLDSREDYFRAVDDYLRFTALDLEPSFQESFAAVGLESPLSAGFLHSLAEALEQEVLALSGFPFQDVARNDWFFDAVSFAWGVELFQGTSETTFSPGLPMDRAMVVTVLHRLAGEPESFLGSPSLLYDDVPDGQWYSDAVTWASELGIIRGYGNRTFAPTQPVTREELAVMIYRMMQLEVLDTEVPGAPLNYYDAGEISGYALEAMQWMVRDGLLSGDGAGRLNPGKQATRAEVAQIMMNLVEYLVMQYFG